MRRSLIKYASIFAFAHFALTVIAIYGSFTIFKGPSTPSEVFWDHALGVLLFPGRLLFDLSGDTLIQVLLWVSNSLLWGVVLAYGVLVLRRSRGG